MAQIKSRGRVQEYGEVFTAEKDVKAMCDLLPAETFSPSTTFLEPTCGDGRFLMEILKRKFDRCEKRSDFSVSISSVYGMDIQPDNVEETINNLLELCREHFKPSKADVETLNRHIMVADSVKVMALLAEYEK